MARIAINGLGRIGRAFLKLALTRPELDIVAVNDLGDPEAIAYLLRFDSVYGRYSQVVAVDSAHEEAALVVGNRRILFTRQPDPIKLPWAALNATSCRGDRSLRALRAGARPPRRGRSASGLDCSGEGR